MHVSKWLRVHYNKITQSIAFIPAMIALGFLLLSWIMLEIDFSNWAKELKADWKLLSLKDAGTARTIISTIAAAVISLTVFSFSMVMIVLNQAASQMSNRVLTSMIENRFQQIILGFYIGTIVYSLFLLSTIRDIQSGIYVPALSIYLLILLTVIDIFLFIYFLDYVTQSVKYETVIQRVKVRTLQTMKTKFVAGVPDAINWEDKHATTIKMANANYFQGFNESGLLHIAQKENLRLSFLYPPSTYLIKEMPYLKIYSEQELTQNILQEILSQIDFFNGQPLERTADYGFSQLAEIAIKALSPGINDPATAVMSLHALADLFSYRLAHHAAILLKDKNEVPRISMQYSTFRHLFEKCIYPIWSYGKDDQYIQEQLLFMMEQLKTVDEQHLHFDLYANIVSQIKEQKAKDIN